MIYIAHRGNTHGIKKDRENDPEYVMDALKMGFDCEVDTWYVNGSWRLGHDAPQHSISLDFLYTPGLWVHCKNVAALTRLIKTDINTFWHQEDDYTLTSKNYIWCYPGKIVDIPDNSICVKPEIHNTDWNQFAGVCSSYVGYYCDQASTL